MDTIYNFNMLQKIPLSGTSKQVLFGLITLLIYVSIGVCRSYVAFLFHQLDLPDSKIHLTDDQKTWIASSMGFLTPFASLISGVLMDILGRRTCMLIMFAPLVVAWTMISVANSYTTLVIAMIVESSAFGMFTSVITYVSEISTTKYRGLLLAMVDVTMNLGVIICSSLMYVMKWNIVAIIFVVLSAGSLLLTLILPESPVWLYSMGKKQRAIDTLSALRSQPEEELEDEIKDMENSFASASKTTGILITMKNCFHAWKQFTIATLLFPLVILSGPFLLLSYTVLIIERLRLPYDSATVALIYSAAGFAGSFLTPIFVHNSKRRTVLGVSSAGMFVSMFAITIYETFYLESTDKPFAWIVPVFLCIFTLLTNLGVLPIGFVIGGELFPLESRGTLQGLYGFVVCIVWTVSLKFYPLVLFDYGIITLLWCFTAGSILVLIYAVFILPETKGKTLNQVQERYFSRKSKTTPKV